jgi:anti-sigma B factor antagonist
VKPSALPSIILSSSLHRRVYEFLNCVSPIFIRLGDNWMEIDIRQENDVIILKPNGRLIGPAAVEFKKVIEEQIANAPESPRLLFDFGKVDMMGSSGLGALMAALMAVERKKGFIALINVGQNVENLMVRSRLLDTFEHFDSEAEAIEALMAD